jgi:hypothetical protein
MSEHEERSNREVREELAALRVSIQFLTEAIRKQTEIFIMSQTALDTALAALAAQTEANTSAIASAEMVIGGIAGQVKAAVDAALAAGATPAQLAAVQALSDKLKTDDAGLAAAIAANTPAA